MTTKQAIIAGLISLDVLPNLATIPAEDLLKQTQSGKMLQDGVHQYLPGGPVANVGLALHRLGIPVRLIGKIGDDLFGKTLQEYLRAEAEHLAQDLVIDLSLPTGFTVVVDPALTDCTPAYSPGANNTLYASDLPRSILESADLFHFSNPALMRSIYRAEGAELISILIRARRAGLSTSLEISFRDGNSPTETLDWPTILANTLPLVDVFTINYADLVYMLDREAYKRLSSNPHKPFNDRPQPDLLERYAERVLRYGVKAVLVRLAQQGLYLRTAPEERWQKSGRGLDGLASRWHNRTIWAPAFEGEVETSLGADDAVDAGFLASLLLGMPPESALQVAAAVGALNITHKDTTAELPVWDALWDRIQGGWQTYPLNLEAHGWLLDQQTGIWEKPRPD